MNNLKYVSLFVFTTLSLISCQRKVVELEMPSTVTHELHEVLRIVDDPSGIFFGNTVIQIEFLSNDNIIIRGGRRLNNVLEISPDGELLNKIGQKGRGPNEFESIDRIIVTPGDTLHVYDSSLSRQQVFFKTDGIWELSRSLLVELEYGQAFNSDFPLKIYQTPADGISYRALMTNTISFNDTTNSYYYYLTDVDKNLVQTGGIDFLKPVQAAAVYRTPSYVASDYNDRFGHSFYLFDQQQNRLIYINNWSNEIWITDQNGNTCIAGLLPFEHFPIDEKITKDYKEIISNYESDRVQLVESKFMDYEPYYRNIYLDHDKLWIQFAREDKSKPEWSISTIEGEIEAVFFKPKNFSPLAVHKGRLYGLQEVNDIPNLVSFELDN